jgi:hypothetical protein
MPLSHYALDTFAAPKLSSLTTCGMPQLEFPDVPFAKVIVTQIFVRPIGPTQIRLLTNTLRWIDGAFASYAAARASLLAYTEGSRGKLRNYYRAVLHTEQCVAATHHSERLVNATYRLLGSIQRPSSDAAERLRKLYNTSKDVDERIEDGEFLNEATIPVWLTNDGIESKDHFLSFVELSVFMQQYIELTDAILKLDRPQTHELSSPV